MADRSPWRDRPAGVVPGWAGRRCRKARPVVRLGFRRPACERVPVRGRAGRPRRARTRIARRQDAPPRRHRMRSPTRRPRCLSPPGSESTQFRSPNTTPAISVLSGESLSRRANTVKGRQPLLISAMARWYVPFTSMPTAVVNQSRRTSTVSPPGHDPRSSSSSTSDLMRSNRCMIKAPSWQSGSIHGFGVTVTYPAGRDRAVCPRAVMWAAGMMSGKLNADHGSPLSVVN